MAEGISLNIIKIIEKGILEHRKEEKTQHPKKKMGAYNRLSLPEFSKLC